MRTLFTDVAGYPCERAITAAFELGASQRGSDGVWCGRRKKSARVFTIEPLQPGINRAILFYIPLLTL